ncbi:cell division protein FtsQ/DivIB [Novosphingobium sp.]|uniref:cell division protein FtsQ/DivIB n=1 Tax=Novosphingobium sp. TaxID=1874826 RepID=UPI002869EE4F|nr:cell division protein FtsQ/DivIB [Novosphingobium sp.]
MSGQKIKRGGKSVRKAVAAQGKARQVRAAKARTGSAVDTLMAVQPFSESQLHHIFLAMILGLAAVLLWVVASFAGLPAMAGTELERLAQQSGFRLTSVQAIGTNHLNELKVYQTVLGNGNRGKAMPFVDLEDIRGRLLQLSWVEDARVSRRLPDTVVVDIIERTPVAVLSRPGRLALIDAKGRELEPISPDRVGKRMVLSGPGAAAQVGALTALLDAAPALKSQIKGAEWIGNRRWNLTFKTGQVLALPEGDEPSAKALVTFAQLDGRNRLLGGKAVAFDMRAGDRIYLRMPSRTDAQEQASAVIAPAKPDTAAAKPAAIKAKPEEKN